jgi:hypothetical protein
MKQTPWIVTTFEGDEVARCQRCGHTLRLTLPMNLTVFTAALKAFVRVHSTCRERPVAA